MRRVTDRLAVAFFKRVKRWDSSKNRPIGFANTPYSYIDGLCYVSDEQYYAYTDHDYDVTEVSVIAEQVLAGEEKRLRAFLQALHETLHNGIPALPQESDASQDNDRRWHEQSSFDKRETKDQQAAQSEPPQPSNIPPAATSNDRDEWDEEDEEKIDDSEVPAGAAFFGIMETKRYYPLESIHEFFSSSDTKHLHGELVELVYFVSEGEAEARGFAPAQGIRCPDCGRLNLIGETYCEECGCPLDATEEYFEDEEDGEGNTEPEEDYEDEHKYDNDLSSVVLGRGINLKTDEEEDVVIGDVERRGGVYILGQPRTGKSTLLVNMIGQDIAHGHGLCFIDPHGDGIEDVLKLVPDDRLDDVILLDPLDEDYAFGINLFACKNPKNRKQISRTINYVLQVFGKLFTESGDLQDAVTMYDTLLNTIILLVYNQSFTLAEVPLLLVNRDAAAKLIDNIGAAHDDEKEWWLEYNRMKFPEKNEVSGSTRRRLRTFLTDEHIRHIVGQSTSTLDFRAIMDTGKILLVKLPREFPELSKLVGSLLIGQLLTAAYSRDDTPEPDRRQFSLVCDEFQNFATPDFAELFTQTGKYHLAPTVAHQERVGQFAEEKKILGATSAAAIKISFQTTVKDADELAPEYARPPEAAWEEVIEKEWVEIVKPQWHERIEEQVEVEVEEDILEISQIPVDYLVSARTTHASKSVRKAIQTILIPLDQAAEGKGDVMQYAHQEKLILSPFVNKEVMNSLDYGIADPPSIPLSSVLEGKRLVNLLLIDMMERLIHLRTKELARRIEDIVVTLAGFIGWFEFSPPGSAYLDAKSYKRKPNETLRHALSSLIGEYVAGGGYQFEEKKAQYFLQLLKDMLSDCGFPKKVTRGFDPPGYYYTELVHPLAQQVIERLRIFIHNLHTLCEELAKDPIRVPTGQKRMVKRIQPYITYLTHESEKITHPRKTISHPKQTEADMVGEMRRELINLPRFTAYCKIVKAVAGKQVVVKYKLFPEPPESGTDGAGSAEWKRAYITQRMHDETLGYYKKRETVEQEIAARRATLKAREPKQKGQTTSDEDEE